MLGRLFKIFLPIFVGLTLIIAGLVAVVGSSSATGDWDGDWEECDEWDDWDWWDWDEDWDEDCEEPSPSPSPSPSPCPEPKGFLNFLNVYASDDYDEEPSPTPCPEEPSPSPSPTPPTGGPNGGPSDGGVSGGPQCPTDRPQAIDQVWFTDIKPNEVTVHWANKGDAHSYHIAYGPQADNLPWGVVVGGQESQVTLKNLPGGDLWVTISAKSSAECGGPTTQPAKVGPQVLGAVGTSQSALFSLAGMIAIGLGLWQAQKGLKIREQKA